MNSRFMRWQGISDMCERRMSDIRTLDLASFHLFTTWWGELNIHQCEGLCHGLHLWHWRYRMAFVGYRWRLKVKWDVKVTQLCQCYIWCNILHWVSIVYQWWQKYCYIFDGISVSLQILKVVGFEYSQSSI